MFELIEKLENSGRLDLLTEPEFSHPLGPEISFFETNGFENKLDQWEMVLEL